MHHGSPAHRPMSLTEYIEWSALIETIEPQEAQERADAMKRRR